MYRFVIQKGKIAPRHAPIKAIIHPPQNPNRTPETNLCKLAGAISKASTTYRRSQAIIPNIPFSGNQVAFSINGASKVCVKKIVNAIPPTTPMTLRLAINFFDMRSRIERPFYPCSYFASKGTCCNC